MKRGLPSLYICRRIVYLLIYAVMSVVQYTQVLSRGCSMNIHKKVVVATVQGKGIPKKSRSYNTFTSSLTQSRDQLVHWVSLTWPWKAQAYIGKRYTMFLKALYHTFGLLMRHIKNVPRHKTDKNDSEWISLFQCLNLKTNK